MLTVYLLIGLPGSGKTTFARNFDKDAKVVSIDNVRQELSDKNIIGKVYSSSDNEIVFKAFHDKLLNHAKENAKSIIVDSTNARLSEREDIYNLFKDYRPKFVALWLQDSKEVCLERIINRNKLEKGVHTFPNPSQALEIYESRINESKPSLNEALSEIIYIKDGKIINKEQKVLIATTNLGKINIYTEIFDELNIKCTNLKEIKVDEDIDETGTTESENAIIKAKAYHEITKLPTLTNDTGLVIDRFKKEDQPGVMVRRYGDKHLSDEEMLEVYINKLNEVGGESSGHVNVALATIDSNGTLKCETFTPRRYYVNKPSKVMQKGVPLASLAYDKETNKYMSEMTISERNAYEKEEMLKQKEFIKNSFIKF